MFLLLPAYPGSPGQRPLNSCVCVCTSPSFEWHDGMASGSVWNGWRILFHHHWGDTGLLRVTWWIWQIDNCDCCVAVTATCWWLSGSNTSAEDWVKKCMEYEVEGARPRGRPKRTWREVVREDCQACKMNKEDAIDRCKWRKLIKDVRWSGWVWVGECFFLVSAYHGSPRQKAVKRLCVCVRVT